MRKLFWAAAVGGGLYWASKQPGGISGVWDKFSGKLKEVQDSPDPLGTLKSSFGGNSFGGNRIEPATPYSSLPEHPSAG
jgi:hypothetical protein